MQILSAYALLGHSVYVDYTARSHTRQQQVLTHSEHYLGTVLDVMSLLEAQVA
jgi:hypothetical protein